MSDQVPSTVKTKVIVTTRGKELTLMGVSPLFIGKLQQAVDLPDAPTKQVGIPALGEVQTEPLTAENAETEEEKAAWQEYVNKRDELLSKRQNNFIKALFAKGVEVALPDLEGWRVEQEYWDIKIPNNPIDLKVEYIQTECVGSVDDIISIITGVLELTGIPKEEMADVESMFRNSVRFRTTVKTADAEGQVAVE
jgi:hypothetical protein